MVIINMDNIKIVKGTFLMHGVINELMIQVHELHVSWRDDIFVSSNELITTERLEFLIDNNLIYVAIKDQEVVGILLVDYKEREFTGLVPKKYLIINTICVDEKYRGKGIGRLLLDFSEVLAKENNCTDLTLSVNKENIAGIKSYENFGFTVKNISYSKPL